VLETNVDQKELSFLETGLPCFVVFDAYPAEKVKANISLVCSVIDYAKGTCNLKLLVMENKPFIKHGMTGSVEISGKKIAKVNARVLALPAKYILHTVGPVYHDGSSGEGALGYFLLRRAGIEKADAFVAVSNLGLKVIDVTSSQDPEAVASIDSVGASGAYYAAVGADYIIATDMSVTGSIGVILQTLTFGDLMGKIGVRSHTFKSGRYKDVLNPTREPTDDEKQLIQSLIMEVYDKFVGIVAEERHMDVTKLKSDAGMADGRILSGKQAQETGFVDEIGYLEDAIEKAKEMAHVDRAKAVRYLHPFSFRDIVRIFGKTDRPDIRVELMPAQLHMETGKLYFLPPYMFQ
jgi:signal peptide peptidase SppA